MKSIRHYLVHLTATLLLTISPAQAGGGMSPTPSGAFKALKPSTNQKNRANENYLGASVGKIESSFCDGLSDCAASSQAWKVYSGVPIQENIIFEGGYIDFGSEGGKKADATQKIDRSGYTTAGVYTVPLSDDLYAFGKGGVLWWKSKEENAGNTTENEGKDLFYGVGADYRVTDNIGIRAEWEQFKNIGSDAVENADVNLLSVGVSMSSL